MFAPLGEQRSSLRSWVARPRTEIIVQGSCEHPPIFEVQSGIGNAEETSEGPEPSPKGSCYIHTDKAQL